MDALTRDDPPRFLTVTETAKALGVAAPTVRRWARDGFLRAVQPAGEQGVLRIPATELQRLAGEESR